jgi:hypothetical protein
MSNKGNANSGKAPNTVDIRWPRNSPWRFRPFIALTDKAWFDFLSEHAERGRIDEVNFWSPKSTSPMKTMVPGEPIFFRLKDPHYSIGTYGSYSPRSRIVQKCSLRAPELV